MSRSSASMAVHSHHHRQRYRRSRDRRTSTHHGDREQRRPTSSSSGRKRKLDFESPSPPTAPNYSSEETRQQTQRTRRSSSWESSSSYVRWSRRRVETEKLVGRKRLALVLDIDRTLGATAGGYCDSTNTSTLNGKFFKELSTMYDLYSNDSKQQQTTSSSDLVRDFSSLRAERSVIVVLQDNPRSRCWGGRGGLLPNVVLINDFVPANLGMRRVQITGNSSSSGTEQVTDDDRMLVLNKMVSTLKKVHRQYFSTTGEENVDVRDVILKIRKSTLKGCKIVLTGVSLDTSKPQTIETHPLWKKAELLGATCSKTVSDDMSHLVCFGSRWKLEDLKWALQNKKLIVGKEWLEAAFLTWSRPNEDFFSAHRS